MHHASINDIFKRDAIGILNQLERMATAPMQAKYPPHTIIGTEEEGFILMLAVAGFSKDELNVQLEKNSLTVTGTKQNKTENPNHKVIHQGISFRDFERSWTLTDYLEVKSVSLENGILKITLVTNRPESQKARKFNID